MDWEAAAQACQKELSCVICMSTFLDPVTTACGHSFCRPCLCLAWQESAGPASCPVCRQPSPTRDPPTDRVLQGLVAIVRRAGLRRFLSSEEGACGVHGRPRHTFCEVDKALLCGRCAGSRQHEAHRHRPAERAVEERRETVLQQMRALWEKMRDNRGEVDQRRRTGDEWVTYVNLHRRVASEAFATLRRAPREEGAAGEEEEDREAEERRYSQALLLEGGAVLVQLRGRESQTLQYGRLLRGTYEELMRTYHLPEADLLREVDSTLECCEALLGCAPGPLRPQLRPPPVPGLMEELQRFRVELSFHKAAGEPLGPDRHRGEHADARRGSEASANSIAFGSQVFRSGRHYWELGGLDSATWAAGVCRESAIGSGVPVSESGDLFVLLCATGNTHDSLCTTSPWLAHYVERPVGRVGVLLDVDNGSVSFWNVAKGSLIWRYPNGSFHFPVRPLFHGGNPAW